MDITRWVEQTEALAAAARALVAGDMTACTDSEVVATLLEIEKVTNMISGAVSHKLVHELGVRSIPGEAGLHNTAKYVGAALGISVSDSNARVKAARDFGELRQLDGRVTEPRHPHTAAGQGDGDINTEKAHRIGLILRKLPRGLERDVYEAAEEALAHAAANCTPEDLSKVGAQLVALLDPDGRLTDDKDRKRRRGITIGEQQGDLMSRVSGWIDPELRAFLDAIMAKWARPGMNNPDGAPRGAVNHIGGERLRSDCVAA